MKTILNLKIIIITIMVLISVSTAQAQLNFEIKVGINGSTQSDLGGIYDNQDILPGLSVGASTLYHFSENFGAQLELNYVQKGRKGNKDNSGGIDRPDNNCDYITIPLVVRGSTLLNEKKSRVYLEAGPYYGIMTNNKRITNAESVSDKEFWGNDLGFVFGGGVIKTIQDINLTIGLRYEMGLVKVSRADHDLRNKTLSLNVGYLF